jgi:hypothetical protein
MDEDGQGKIERSKTMNDGGPAFPNSIDTAAIKVIDVPGMSLRDWFAGMALTGLTSVCDTEGQWKCDPDDLAAKAAYMLADAMIKERNKL